MSKMRISDAEIAVTAVRMLQEQQGWTLPEAVAEVISQLDAASVEMVIARFAC